MTGMERGRPQEPTGWARPGQDLLVAGPIGLLGTRLLAAAYEQELPRWFSKSYGKKLGSFRGADISPYIQSLQELGATGIMAAGEGGIARAIWDASGAWRVGVTFSLGQIPVRQGTIEICERCGCNPYRLWCEDCLVLTAENGGRLAGACRERGILAAVIGTVEAGTARKIRHGEVTGYLERPREDELYRLLGKEKVLSLQTAIEV